MCFELTAAHTLNISRTNINGRNIPDRSVIHINNNSVFAVICKLKIIKRLNIAVENSSNIHIIAALDRIYRFKRNFIHLFVYDNL